jgi:epoxyqueuosine reductase
MLKNKIINYSKRIGIDVIGFTSIKIVPELTEKLKLQEQLDYSCEFQKGTIEERTNPKLLMDNVKTIIVIALGYSKTCNQLKNLTNEEVYFSSSSWGQDYHLVLHTKLNKLATYIKKEVSNFEYKIIVDTSPLCDRTIAYQAGLGFFGKNNLLINEKYGSYIFLGSILTNLDLKPDQPINKSCLNCNKCINACPTGALNNNGVLNSKKCLSYITQKKGEITKQEQQLMNNCIYGCDICQQVCPYNNQNNNKHAEFNPTGVEFINVNMYEPLSNKSFKLKYGHLAGAWRGPKIINRNIEIYQQKLKDKLINTK